MRFIKVSRLWLLLMRSLEGKGATQTGRAGMGLPHPCPLSPGTRTWRTSGQRPIPHTGRERPLAPVLAGLSWPPRAVRPQQPPTRPLCHGASSQIRVSAGPAGPSPAGLSRDRARRVTDTFSHRVLAHFSALQFRQCTKKPSSSSLYITPWTTKRFIWRKR